MSCKAASAPWRAGRRAVSAAEIAAYQALSRKYLAPPWRASVSPGGALPPCRKPLGAPR